MRIKSTLLFLTISVLISFQGFATEGEAILSFEVIKTNEDSVLKLSISLINEYQTSEDYRSNAKDRPKAHDFNDLISQIIDQIKTNNSIDININRPEYFNQILALIPKPSDKEKAITLYNDNNYIRAISKGFHQTATVKDGHSVNKVTLDLLIPLDISVSTILTLKSMTFEFNSKNYKTATTNIKL